MRRRWAWLAAGGGIVAAIMSIGCGPTETTCEESATCPGGSGGSGGASGSGGSAGNGGGAAGGGTDGGVQDVSAPSDADASIDGVKPDDARSDARDADISNDPSPGDVRIDGIDAPIADVPSEPDACDPGPAKSPVDSACLIGEKYGVFVSPVGSDATGMGTRAAPFKTLTKAIQLAKGNTLRVYACDDGSGFTENVTLDGSLDGVNLFGGFECSTWSYATTRRARLHPATGVPLTLKTLTVGTTIEDFEFDSPDGALGQSSIGVLADTALNVVLRGVKVVAGKGGGGAKGDDGAKGEDGNAVTGQQGGVAADCSPSVPAVQPGGAWGINNACGFKGGNGGQANKDGVGSPGTPGSPTTNVTPPNVNNRGTEGNVGGDGAAGSPGNAGESGALTPSPGTFSATGYTAAPTGGEGKAGFPGQGGGGGGASNAPSASNCIGASGGAGGMGGCGGTPGKGGASAGASVGLLSWSSAITLDRCEITSGTGGAGGNGGSGGKGGAGRMGAPGGAQYVGDAGPPVDAGQGLGKGGNGGIGGNGGNGGSGAGGNGGPSYAIVYKGTKPGQNNGTFYVHGAGGTKGIGGTVDAVKAPDGNVGPADDLFLVP